MSFLFLFRVPFAVSAYFGVLSNFLTCFSRLPLRLLLLVFFVRSVSFILFSLKTLSPQTWIITISSRWQSFSSTGIVALRVGYDLQNTQNYYSTANSPVWFRTQNAGCTLFAYAASHLLAHVKLSCKMPNRVPAVLYTEARHSNMRLRTTFSLALPLRNGSVISRGTVGRAC